MQQVIAAAGGVVAGGQTAGVVIVGLFEVAVLVDYGTDASEIVFDVVVVGGGGAFVYLEITGFVIDFLCDAVLFDEVAVVVAGVGFVTDTLHIGGVSFGVYFDDDGDMFGTLAATEFGAVGVIIAVLAVYMF